MKANSSNPIQTALTALLLLVAVGSSRAEQTNILTISDASGSSSFNASTHWLYPVPPGSGTNYFTGAFTLRTPVNAGNYIFAGDSLTIGSGGGLSIKGGSGNLITITNLTNSGVINCSINPNTIASLAGNMTVVGTAAFNTSAGSGDVRVITNGLAMSGSGTLTNLSTVGNYPGTVVYTSNNLAFTGELIATNATTIQAHSLANLGGNPASFNAAQLTLSYGILQPTASFALNNPNSGVTLGAGGGAFNIASGLTLTIVNPIAGAGGLTNLAAGSLILNTTNAQLNVAGTNTYTGPTVVNAGTLLVNGTHTVASGTSGFYAINNGAMLGGAGLIDLSAVNAGVTLAAGAKLSPGAAAGAAGTLTFNLGSGTLNISGAASAASLLFDIGAIGASDAVVLNSGTLNIGNGVLGFNSFIFNAQAGLSAGTYTLFQAPGITGTLGSNLTGVVGAYNAALSLSGGNVLLTLTVPAHPIPVFSNLTPSQTNRPGISPVTITLTGNLTAVGPTYPANGESGTVSATINGVTANGTFTDAVGDFSITINTAGLPVATTPYTITYSYAGNGTLGAAANNNSTTLTMQPPVVLGAGDALGSTSFNVVGNWVLYGTTTPAPTAPTAGNYYNTLGYGLRTPPATGNFTFGGDQLIIAGTLNYKGTGPADIITGNWYLAGGAIGNGVGGDSPTIAGTLAVTAPSGISLGAAGRSFNISATLSGSSLLTNGYGFAGLVTYTNDNATAFTGPMLVNGGTTIVVGSQTNLGGNPASFNPAQLTLDNGILQVPSSFSLSNPNSGVTLNPGGGAFNVGAGLALTIVNPITGPGGLTNLAAGSLILNPASSGPNTYTGPTVVNAGTLLVNGTHTAGPGATGGYAINNGATFGGNGLIDLSAAGFGVTIASGAKLSPGAAANTVGTLSFNLGAGALDISGAVTPAASASMLFDLGAINASDKVVLNSGTLNIGNGVLNFGSFAFNALAGLQAGTYTLFQATAITGTLGTGLTGVVGGFNAALGVNGNNIQLTLTVPAHPIPTIGNLTPSQTIVPGTPTITLTGNVAAIGPTYPPQGESGTISATINGVTATGRFTDAVGDFAITFNTSGIIFTGTPYTITYNYAGNGTLGAAANNTTTTLSIQTPVVLHASDALGSSSFNTVGNWVLYGTTTPPPTAPTTGSNYNTAGFSLRTPATGGNYTFGGDSLTIASGGALNIKGASGNIITINSLFNAGTINDAINPNSIGVLAGNMTVVGAATLNTAGIAAGDVRILTNGMTLFGSGALTNSDVNATANNAGTVVFTANNTAFTGPLTVNSNQTLQVSSQANLGGSPASFNPAQLTLDNGILQAAASFVLNNANSGITISPNGGAFDVIAGATLAIDEPITNSTPGSGELTSMDGGTLVLNGNNSSFTAGVSVVQGSTFDLAGSLGCGVTSDNTSTIEGTGTAAGTLDVSGSVLGGTTATAGTLTATGLILEPGAQLGGSLTAATTVGQGVNSFLQINGPVTLNNNNIVINPHGTLSVGSTYTIMACTGGVNGSFAPVATTANSEYSFSVAQVTVGASTLIQLTVSAEQNCVLTASDPPGLSSWNTAGNWSCGNAPAPGATFGSAGFVLNTPAESGNQVFAGDLLTVGPGGSVLYEGTGRADILSANWVLNNGAIVNGSTAGGTPYIAGNLALTGPGGINPGAGGSVYITANLTGTNILTNGLGQAGTVIYTADNATAFTGPVLVNGGTILQCGSLTNLGGNPAVFNAAQLTLDNGEFQPEASFALNNPNSGITITANGGTIDVPSGITLTIDNPLAGNGVLTNTDGGQVVLNGNNSGFTGGVLAINGITLDVLGSLGGGLTNDGSSTMEGAGTNFGTVDVSGIFIAGSSANTAGTWTVGGLVLENGATLSVSLASATTIGQGTNSFIQVNGNLTLNNNNLNVNFLGRATIGSTYTVLACTGTVTGSFAPVITTPNGDTFNVSTVVTSSNTLVQVTFTAEPTFMLNATDAFGNSSWNTAGNWSSGAAPVGGADYNTAAFTMRTPANAGNYSFAGDSLTIASGGGLSIKGGSGNVITINDLTNSGLINCAINPNTIAVVAGNMTVLGGAGFNTSSTGSGDVRTITNDLTMFGDGTLTNTCVGADLPGLVVYTANNTAFTGPVVVNNDTTLQAASPANLGGSPASFNAAQLTLDNGTFQPSASLDLNTANSGITITANGGAFDVPAGLALTIDNPLTGPGLLTSTDTGLLVLNGNNSGLTGGLQIVNGSTVDLNGSLGGGITSDNASTLEGTGTATGTVTIAGALIPGTVATAGTLTAGGLVLNSGAVLKASLSPATTTGSGVNSLVQVSGPVVLNNNNIVIHPLGTLPAGNTYTVLSCTGGITGSFAPVAHSADGTIAFNVTTVTSGSSTLVQLTVQAPARPVFNNVAYSSGHLVVSGRNGVAGQSFYVLATTNLTAPFAGWETVATNAFDPSGNFNVSLPVSTTQRQEFFQLLTQ